MKLAEG